MQGVGTVKLPRNQVVRRFVAVDARVSRDPSDADLCPVCSHLVQSRAVNVFHVWYVTKLIWYTHKWSWLLVFAHFDAGA